MPFYRVTPGNGNRTDLNQLFDAFTGQNDVGAITPYAQINPPSALTAAINTTSGNLTGAYQYKVAHITGYWQGPTGTGFMNSQGNTGGGLASNTVSPSAQQNNLSAIPIGGIGVVARIIYRTKANGSTFYFLQQINDNVTTSWTDNLADSALTQVMPTANTTGSYFSGNGQGLTNIPMSGLTGILPIASGGTGSSTQNFVDLTTTQTIAGVKTFSSAISSPQNPNLAFNPSFRLGAAGWSGIGTNGFNLAFGGGGEGGYLSNATSIGASGVQVDNNGNGYKFIIPATPSLALTLSGEIYAGGVTSGSIGFQWFAFDSNKVAISGGAVNATNGTGWTKYSVTFTTPANTAYIQIACLMSANTTNTNAAWRKIKLEAGSVATTFSDDSTFTNLQYPMMSRYNTLDDGTGGMSVIGDIYTRATGTTANLNSRSIYFEGRNGSNALVYSSIYGSNVGDLILNAQAGTKVVRTANNVLEDGTGRATFLGSIFLNSTQSGAANYSPSLVLHSWNGTAGAGTQIQSNGSSGGWYSTDYANSKSTFTVDDAGNSTVPGYSQALSFRASEGTGAGNGYSFTQDGGFDTGMYSHADGDLRFYANNVDVMDMTSGSAAINVPLTIAAGGSFANSLGTSGYQKLPGGVIIQWGTLSATSPGPTGAINFPIAFPNICRSVSGIAQLGGCYCSLNGNLGASFFNLYLNGASGTTPIFWIAVGY